MLAERQAIEPARQAKVFVINLDRRPDRWAAMSAQLDRLGISAERIPAVDARLLAAQEGRGQGTNDDPPGYNLSLGEVACAWSHRKALRAFLDTGEHAALILEDDVELAPDTPSLLESAEWWPPDAHAVRLEDGCLQPRNLLLLWPASAETPSGRSVHRLERFATGTAAYLINREAAVLVLPHLEKPTIPLDHLFFDKRHSLLACNQLQSFQIVPAAATQIEGEVLSDIHVWRRDSQREWSKYGRLRRRQTFFYRIGVKALRFAGKVKPIHVYYSRNAAV